MSMSIQFALIQGADKLKHSELENPKLDTEILLAHCLNCAREDLFTQFDRVLTSAEFKEFKILLNRRHDYEPIARIIGYKEFWSLNFELNEDTLIPRPDSETLVECVLDYAKQAKVDTAQILDMGTGSGCLLLAVLSELTSAKGLGVDMSLGALEAAKNNAKKLGIYERATFAQYNWMTGEGEKIANNQYEIIISNPPYIESNDISTLAKEVADFDPTRALDGGDDGLDHYRKIASEADSYLVPSGAMFLEIGEGQGAAIKEIFTGASWALLSTHNDMAGKERVLAFTQN